MAVNLLPPAGWMPVPGLTLAATSANIKYADRDDLAILLFHERATVAGVFTKNIFRAAPVVLAESNLKREGVRALLINSGNANAATGQQGFEHTVKLCAAVAAELKLSGDQVLPFSTGVIGEQLPMAKMLPAITNCIAGLGPDNWHAAARAILTTDTVAKLISRQVDIGGTTITITGMAKGSGMICPDMATMLAFIVCDAPVAQPVLNSMLKRIVNVSFNRVTVDGDTSTNDSLILAATGVAEIPAIQDDDQAQELEKGICEVAIPLAQALVRDGEGATKFVTVAVAGAKDSATALKVAFTVAESPLVKTAMFAEDANWGRLCMAIGRAPVQGLIADKINIHLDEVAVVRGGLQAPDYSEAAGSKVMARDEYTIAIDLGMGNVEEKIWTTDLSHDYITINAEYRT